jgi:hypothetical protein
MSQMLQSQFRISTVGRGFRYGFCCVVLGVVLCSEIAFVCLFFFRPAVFWKKRKSCLAKKNYGKREKAEGEVSQGVGGPRERAPQCGEAGFSDPARETEARRPRPGSRTPAEINNLSRFFGQGFCLLDAHGLTLAILPWKVHVEYHVMQELGR